MKKSWRRADEGTINVIVESPASSKTDKFFLRSAQTAQVLGIIVAIVGYFYTVRPVYQKQLLDEQIAHKTIELNQKNAEILAKAAEVSRREDELKRLGVQLREARALLDASGKQVSELKAKQGTLYSELRVHLATQFRLGAYARCGRFERMSDIKAKGLEACILRELKENSHVAQMTPKDRALLSKVVNDKMGALLSDVDSRLKTHAEQKEVATRKVDELKAKARVLREEADKEKKNYELGQRAHTAFYDALQAEIPVVFMDETARGGIQDSIFKHLGAVWSGFVNDRS